MYKSKKVKLTPLAQKDVSILYRWINDRKLARYNSAYKPIDEKSHEEWFNKIRKSRNIVIFAIRKTTNNKLIGTCQLHSISQIHRHAELQIRIGEINEQSKGYGTDAVCLLIKYGFNDMNLNKIYLHVFSDNIRAIKTYRKVGLKQEGLLREHIFIDGQYLDVMLMGILKKEYGRN